MATIRVKAMPAHQLQAMAAPIQTRGMAHCPALVTISSCELWVIREVVPAGVAYHRVVPDVVVARSRQVGYHRVVQHWGLAPSRLLRLPDLV